MFHIKTINENLLISGVPSKPTHFDMVSNRGVTHVISLETRVDAEEFAKRDIAVSSFYYPDHTPIRPEFLETVTSEMENLFSEGHTLLVHDMGGRTRAGTVVAAHFIRQGYAPWRALRKVWWAVPSAKSPMINYYQDRQLYRFHRWLHPELDQESDYLERVFKFLGLTKDQSSNS